jgi:hypothetical protein
VLIGVQVQSMRAFTSRCISGVRKYPWAGYWQVDQDYIVGGGVL